MNTERLVEALRDCNLNPTEIADVLWLAMRQPPIKSSEPLEPGKVPDISIESVEKGVVPLTPPPDISNPPPPPPQRQENPSAGIAPQPPQGTIPPKALPISVPDAGFLEETLPLVRALKPLLKQIPSTRTSRINENATVERIAETDIWSPIMLADGEPWFEVALVIDASAAMSLWQRLIKDIQRLLRCYGSFRNFRTWELIEVEGKIGLKAASDPLLHEPEEIIAADRTCLVMVFSDCTADYWWNGTLQPILALWGTSMPTVIWQVLPDWMWKRTALGVGEYVAIRNRIPGATSPELQPKYLSLRPKLSRQPHRQGSSTNPSICLPVITAEGKSIAQWSGVLAGDYRQVSPGFILPATGWERFSSRSISEANDSLEQFRLRATPEARRLAALLSAAPVITLPIMRLIRAAMLSGSSPLPVAEVFLSGLLQKAPHQTDAVDPELVQYDFPAAIRDLLLDILPPVQAITVIEAVSSLMAERLNLTLTDFRALLLSPDLREEADRYGLRAFAQITAKILRKLGGEYAALAAHLENPQQLQLVDFPLEDLEYEVAEFIKFPPLQTCTYEAAFITAILERFEFETATIQQKSRFLGLGRPEWIIARSQGANWGYVEPLSEDIALEMILIPEGSFMMGAPRTEPESSNSERPQHEVHLQTFYLGRYPVTQAQWRIVVEGHNLIHRGLDPDPSIFKGDKLPVENVSWEDAQEFCQRLSAKTGKDYRLPSEAQWEYACRAGTTSPFNFGEIITTELANYNGEYSYNNSPKGNYRRRTTEVGSFPANPWGLHDMHGNVWEWCADDWHEDYNNAPTDGSAWLKTVKNDQKEAYKLLRGGSWLYDPRYCRSASRNADSRGYISNSVGLRICCVPPSALLSS